MEAMAKLNGTGLENGYGIIEVPEGSGLEAAVAALKGKMNGNGKDDVVMSKSNVVVGTPEIKVNVANMPQINVGIGTGFGATPAGVPDMPQVKGSSVERMSKEDSSAAREAGIFGERVLGSQLTEELLYAPWYLKHIENAFGPGSTKENKVRYDLSKVTDEKNNAALYMFPVVINDKIYNCVELQEATFKFHLDAGYKIVLQVVQSFKGVRYYPISYKLNDEGNIAAVIVHGLTHPVKEGDKNKVDAEGKTVFEFNDGITIQVSAQLHTIAHKQAQVFVDWARERGLEY